MAEGYHDFVAGDKPTAADLEDYCELQGIMRFASASARDTALSTVKTEGMFAYLKDTNTLTVYTGSAWSTIGPVHGALTSWTPAITQSGSVTCTVNGAWYTRIGRLVMGQFVLTVTGSGTASNLVTVSLPITSTAVVGDVVGSGFINDVSIPQFVAVIAVLHSTTTMRFNAPFTTGAESVARFGSGYDTDGLANGDEIHANFFYQAAADA